jgi:hypothetical protein
MSDLAKYDRLDQIRAHLLDDEHLPETQQKMLERYRAAYSWMCENQSPARAIKLAETEFGISYAQAAKIVRDCIALFGDVHAYSKEGMKHLMYERFLALGEKAEKEKDFTAAERAYDKAAKVLDLYNPKAKAFDIAELLKFEIIFTQDPEALKQETIEIEHEED